MDRVTHRQNCDDVSRGVLTCLQRHSFVADTLAGIAIGGLPRQRYEVEQ